MKLLCLDIGNTTAHLGLWNNDHWEVRSDLSTKALETASPADWEKLLSIPFECKNLAFCSVVPAATEQLLNYLTSSSCVKHMLHLNAKNCPGLAFDYPNPNEAGPDRLANTIGAQHHYGVPAIVIDMGTATTFDLVTPLGYAGGIIAPGIALMSRYLHEKTALLPLLTHEEMHQPIHSAWGKNTREAMRIGCVDGFRGMIRSLLASVMSEMTASFPYQKIHLITTGGTAQILPDGWHPDAVYDPDLTLKGLKCAFEHGFAGV
jgi:type III pantothenate kinase